MRKYYTYNDSELFILIQQGDDKAFAVLYDRYWESLYRHAKRMIGDEGLAQDVIQDVFISLWDKIANLQLEFSIKSYLYSAVRNKILNYIEHHKVKNNYLKSLAEFMSVGENITDYMVRERMLKDKIEEAVLLLPVKMKQVFEMSRNENLSYKEIAKTLNLSDKTVKKQVSNAIKILRLKLTSLLCLILFLV